MWVKLTSLTPEEGMLIIIRWGDSKSPGLYMYEAGMVTDTRLDDNGKTYTITLQANDKENSALNNWKLTVDSGEWKEIEKD